MCSHVAYYASYVGAKGVFAVFSQSIRLRVSRLDQKQVQNGETKVKWVAKVYPRILRSCVLETAYEKSTLASYDQLVAVHSQKIQLRQRYSQAEQLVHLVAD